MLRHIAFRVALIPVVAFGVVTIGCAGSDLCGPLAHVP
jgi:hypothetical protein